MELTDAEIGIIHQFFGFLDIPADQIQVSIDADVVNINVNVPESDAGIFIGRYASTIDSLQLLLSLLLNRGESHRHILLDIGGYRSRRADILGEMVDRVSTQVLESGVARALPPISATERRQVHLMLSTHESLTTYSQGEGQDRRLFIALRSS